MRTPLCWLLAVSLSLSPWRSDACPVYGVPTPPIPPLGRQIDGAQAIVVAGVEGYSTEPLLLDTGEETGLHLWVRHLRVLRSLKGSVPARFRVTTNDFAEEVHAFTPAQEARPRILFVQAQEEAQVEGEAPMLSVQELELEDSEDLAVFVDRIQEAQWLREKRASSAERREWLVRCAARRATRGHGVEELLAESSRTPLREQPQLAEELTLAQRRAILDGFRHEPSTDGSFVGVLALARGVVHPAFDRVAVGVMETLLAEPELELDTPEALYLLLERLGVEDPGTRWSAARQEPEDAEDWERLRAEADQRLRALWEAVRAEGRLVPSPRVPHARSAVDRLSLSVD